MELSEISTLMERYEALIIKVARLEAALHDTLEQMEHVEEMNMDWVRPWFEWQNIKEIVVKALGGE